MSEKKPYDEKDQVIDQFAKKCRCNHSFYESCCNSDYATMRSLAGEIVRLRQRADRAEDAIARVRALYAGWTRVSGDGYCVRCLATLRALDGDA